MLGEQVLCKVHGIVVGTLNVSAPRSDKRDQETVEGTEAGLAARPSATVPRSPMDFQWSQCAVGRGLWRPVALPH